MAMLGGIHDSSSCENNVEIEGLGRFAVNEHNKEMNASLKFGRVVKAQEQVVTGTMHHLTIEAISGGKKMLYKAKVWVKPWLDFKALQEFKQVDDSPSITPADLGVKKVDHGVGWKKVSVEDPAIMNAAKHAVETIQQRSNSLIAYELQEILAAKAEVIDMSTKFEMLLNVKRGDKNEKLKVQVHKNDEGVLDLKQMEQDHS